MSAVVYRCYRVAPGVYVRAVDCPIHLAATYRLPFLAEAARARRDRVAQQAEKAAT